MSDLHIFDPVPPPEDLSEVVRNLQEQTDDLRKSLSESNTALQESYRQKQVLRMFYHNTLTELRALKQTQGPVPPDWAQASGLLWIPNQHDSNSSGYIVYETQIKVRRVYNDVHEYAVPQQHTRSLAITLLLPIEDSNARNTRVLGAGNLPHAQPSGSCWTLPNWKPIIDSDTAHQAVRSILLALEEIYLPSLLNGTNEWYTALFRSIPAAVRAWIRRPNRERGNRAQPHVRVIQQQTVFSQS